MAHLRRLVLLFLAAALLLVGACASSGVTDPARARRCGQPEARAFDFWLGEWEIAQQIRTADGAWLALPAHNAVHRSPDGCVIVEHWRGDVQFFWEGMTAPEAIDGFSVRTYDPRLHAWRIYWLDSRNPAFGAPYVGNFDGGRGEFRREVDTPAGRRSARILFTDIGVDSLEWALETSPDDGASWTPLWRMSMRRR